MIEHLVSFAAGFAAGFYVAHLWIFFIRPIWNNAKKAGKGGGK